MIQKESENRWVSDGSFSEKAAFSTFYSICDIDKHFATDWCALHNKWRYLIHKV